MAASKKQSGKTPSNGSGKQGQGMSPEEQKEEAAKTAQSAVAAQKKAQELAKAAAGAGDPDERQKLLKQKLEQDVKAEKFGKTARYLQSGTFQGLIAGTGLGGGIGAGLGTLTAGLVGGPLSIVSGGLGAGVGALHGPFFKLSDWAGDGIAKITGSIPGWEATPEQKQALEKMVGQVEETEAPSSEDLEKMAGDTNISPDQANDSAEQTWGQLASSVMPDKNSMPSIPGMGSGDDGEQPKQEQPKKEASAGNEQKQGQCNGDQQKKKPRKLQTNKTSSTGQQKPAASRQGGQSEDGKAGGKTPSESSKPSAKQDGQTPKKPRKLEHRSPQGSQTSASAESKQQQQPKSSPSTKKPKKLEMRSGA